MELNNNNNKKKKKKKKNVLRLIWVRFPSPKFESDNRKFSILRTSNFVLATPASYFTVKSTGFYS